jgi:hypothetical protein
MYINLIYTLNRRRPPDSSSSTGNNPIGMFRSMISCPLPANIKKNYEKEEV